MKVAPKELSFLRMKVLWYESSSYPFPHTIVIIICTCIFIISDTQVRLQLGLTILEILSTRDFSSLQTMANYIQVQRLCDRTSEAAMATVKSRCAHVVLGNAVIY